MLNDLFRHMEWADAQVLRAALAAPGDGFVRERLVHIHTVQRSFLDVWRGGTDETPEIADFQALREFARETNAAIQAFLNSGPDLDRKPPIVWRERSGAPAAHPATVRDMMLQVVTHSSYHRGQVNTRLREIGGTPPLTDFVVWVWKGKPGAEW